MGASLATSQAIGTIADDDAEPTLSIESARAVEGDERIGFPVRLSAESGRTVTVEYATRGVSATKDVDYQVASGTLSLAPGTITETIWVTVVDDVVEEEDETLEVVLTELRNAAPGELIGTGVIEDDDAAPAIPALLVRDVRVREADGRLGFLVELDGESERTVTVAYQTRDVSATAGLDYEEAAGTLSIPPGSSGETVWVTLLDDSLDEDDETFELLLTQPEGGTPGALVAMGTIEDDDAPPALRVDDARASESDGAIGFPVRLSAASGRTVTVEYATRALSATSDEDYRAASGSLTFEPGSTGETVWVMLLDDVLDEDEERLQLSVTRAGGEVSEDLVATGTIVDNDAPPALRVEDVRASEADGPHRLPGATLRRERTDGHGGIRDPNALGHPGTGLSGGFRDPDAAPGLHRGDDLGNAPG